VNRTFRILKPIGRRKLTTTHKSHPHRSRRPSPTIRHRHSTDRHSHKTTTQFCRNSAARAPTFSDAKLVSAFIDKGTKGTKKSPGPIAQPETSTHSHTSHGLCRICVLHILQQRCNTFLHNHHHPALPALPTHQTHRT
jgi:hypothetical protein